MIRAETLGAALDGDQADWSDVDLAVERVVATRLRFDDILSRPPPGREVLAGPAHRAVAREAAAKSVVMLRNEPVDGAPLLPLDLPAGSTIALLGTLATAVNLGDGGSSDVWAPEVVTIADGLQSAFPEVKLVIDNGADLEQATATAASADLVMVVVGYTRLDEGEFIGDTGTAHLRHLFPGDDDPELVDRFAAEIAVERLIEPPSHVAPRIGRRGIRRSEETGTRSGSTTRTSPSSGWRPPPTGARWWPWSPGAQS